ncbi:M81 family metallopeptidase [Arenibaculum sp.]|jgi:microcystin degradation protein MlrC|uniref:M81 family metallopeptidase n=1 Tax=Arenibaculum sp. TaxID=2865862 RepID=UPI002E0FD4AF|nr:M81 family metallopeptidase [Arenibaculum sp.]
MRLLLAMMKHETNTFSPVPTDLARFARGRPALLAGAEAVAAYRGTGTVTGAYIDVAGREGAEIVLPVAADAWPSGPVDDEAYRVITDAICEQVAKGGFDGILLDLHGAMVTRSLEDGEGALLARIRELDPRTPVGVSLDMHANLYDEIVGNATVVCGYHTYPHVDMYETGWRAADILVRAIRGEVRPVMAWGNVPMLPHVMRQGTADHPNRGLQARAMEMEAGGALAASLFVGFPHADIRNAGLSVVTVADGDAEQAKRLRDELLGQAWDLREDFVYRVEPLAQSVARARDAGKDPGEGPVVLLDHYDNAASGGTMDTTAVLGEILRQGLENAAAFAIFDPDAVRKAIAAGIGAEVTLSIGGKMAMPMLPVESPPLGVTGRVRTISDGRFRNKGPMAAGVLMDMGPTVVLDTGKVEIVLVSRHQEPNDVNCFLSLGIDPMQKRFLMLKSRIHWRAGLGHVARTVVECAGTGVCTSDYGQLRFDKVRRPVFPLDPMAA